MPFWNACGSLRSFPAARVCCPWFIGETQGTLIIIREGLVVFFTYENK